MRLKPGRGVPISKAVSEAKARDIGMTSQDDAFSRVEHPPEIEDLLEHLTQPGAASLALDKTGGEPMPVVVFEVNPGAVSYTHLTLPTILRV